MNIIIRSSVLLLLYGTSASSFAVGAGAGGRDILHVPMSWCIVNGSPAQASPNVNGDTDTDAVIWRRHERPTDNIFLPQADISLRSGINNAWGSFNFPLLNDPNTTLATAGDVRGENVNTNGAEFNALIQSCDLAYNAIGRAGIGVTVVNAGLFHDAGGAYVGIIGWGGCAEVGGACVAPYDGRVMVVDNHYLYPSVPNRNWPGTSSAFTLTDPFDGLTGHEVGHALSLDHRNNTTALMNPSISDNNADGQTDNIGLNAAEITALRANALNVPGLEIDPPGVFNPGRFSAIRLLDDDDFCGTGPRPPFPPHRHLAAVKFSLDREGGGVSFGQQLCGLLPQEGTANYWFLLDSDGPGAGASAEELQKLGIPTRFAGAEVIGVITAKGRTLSHRGWIWNGDKLLPGDRLFVPQLQTMVMHPRFADVHSYGPEPDPIGQLPKDVGHPLFDIIALNFNGDLGPVKLDQPLRVQTLIETNGQVLDRLDDGDEDQGKRFHLENAHFAHCFPQGEPAPGGKVKVDFDGLEPKSPVHALLGPQMLVNGMSDANGGGTIELPIPANTVPGPHLVTIGVDNTALTADCTVNVVGCPGDFDRDGDVDGRDVATFRKDIGRRDCPILKPR